MEYKNKYNEDGINIINIPELKGKTTPEWYDGSIIDDMDMDKYYYELYLLADDENRFDHAEVYKVGEKQCSEYYAKLNTKELTQIVDFIQNLFNND